MSGSYLVKVVSAPTPIRLTTEWKTTSPVIAAELTYLNDLPELSRERMEIEAALHTWQAQHLHRLIGQLHRRRAT